MHYTLRNYSHRRSVFAFVAIVVLLAVMAAIGLYSGVFTGTEEPTEKQSSKVATPKPQDGVSTHMLFVGDVFWARRVQTLAEASSLGSKFITKGLSSSDRANYDAWIGNFECPITTKDVPYEQQTDLLRFNCRPEYLPELSRWFTAASQANNHTMNNGGEWGLDQTRQNLEKNGIQYFGNYNMDKLNDICEVIAMPATTTYNKKPVRIPVALCGYMYVVDTMPSQAQLDVMTAYAKVMPVIAMPHMGVEYRTTGEQAKIEAYHRMIDAGADAVIAAHPHVIQNSEAYKGKLIAYSLGNFLFDQQRFGTKTSTGLGVGMRLTIPDEHAAKIYEKVGQSCMAYKDTCLSQLQSKISERPSMTVAYNFACYDESTAVGSVPTLADEAVCDSAKQTATIDQLGGLSDTW